MAGNNKLAVVKAHRLLQILHQLLLSERSQAVFRLVQQVQRIFRNIIEKIANGTFAVRLFPYVQTNILLNIHRKRIIPHSHQLRQLLQIIVAMVAEAAVILLLQFQIFSNQLLASAIYTVVDNALVQYKIKYIIAGDNSAT